MTEQDLNQQVFFEFSRSSKSSKQKWIEKWLQSGKVMLQEGLCSGPLNFPLKAIDPYSLIENKIVSGLSMQKNGLFACIDLKSLLYHKEYKLLKELLQLNPTSPLFPLVLLKKLLIENNLTAALKMVDKYWMKNQHLHEEALLVLLTESLLMEKKEASLRRYNALQHTFHRDNSEKAIFVFQCFGEKEITCQALQKAESEAKTLEECVHLAETFLYTIKDKAKTTQWIEEAEKHITNPDDWFWLAEVCRELEMGSVAENRCRRIGSIFRRIVKSTPQQVFISNEYHNDLEELEKSASNFNVWLNLATEWYETADNPLRSIRCLIKAEELADRFSRWTECARLWKEMFGQKEEAAYCLRESGKYVFNRDRADACKKFFRKYAGKKMEEIDSCLFKDKTQSPITKQPEPFQERKETFRFFAWNNDFMNTLIQTLDKNSLAFDSLVVDAGNIENVFQSGCLHPKDIMWAKGIRVAGFYDFRMGLLNRCGLKNELQIMLDAQYIYSQEHDNVYYWYLWVIGKKKDAISIFEKEMQKENNLKLNHYFFLQDILKDMKRAESYLHYLTMDIIHEKEEIWKKKVLADYAKVWMLDFQNNKMAEKCLKEGLKHANSEMFCIWAEVFINVYSNETKASEYLEKALIVAKTEYDWITCARYHLYLFNDRLCARYALQKAEIFANNTFDMIQVAGEWLLLFNDSIRARKCLKRAYYLKENSEEDTFEAYYLNESWENILNEERPDQNDLR